MSESAIRRVIFRVMHSAPGQAILKQSVIKERVRFYVLRYREKHFARLTEKGKEEDLKKWYRKVTGEHLSLEHPANLGQVIQWLKLYDNMPEKTILSDKYRVREWIQDQLGEEYLIPLLGVWDRAEDIPFDDLPRKVVFKANHGSGMNLVIRDTYAENLSKLRRQMNRWMRTPYDLSGMEQQYYGIERRIIAEEYIEQSDGNLMDYKVHCFHGIPKFIEVIGDRNLHSHDARVVFVDTEWKRISSLTTEYRQYDILPDRPECLPQILETAKKLSKAFLYVRVDLYVIGEKILFGEMTFTPSSGMGKWCRQIPADWVKLPTHENRRTEEA